MNLSRHPCLRHCSRSRTLQVTLVYKRVSRLKPMAVFRWRADRAPFLQGKLDFLIGIKGYWFRRSIICWC